MSSDRRAPGLCKTCGEPSGIHARCGSCREGKARNVDKYAGRKLDDPAALARAAGIVRTALARPEPDDAA